jgi:hypothetical protein
LSLPTYSQTFTLATSFVNSYAMLFVALLVAAAAVSASPIAPQAKTVALSLKHHSNVSSVKNIVHNGQARINKINGATAVADASSGPVTNEDVSYVAPVSIGGATWQLIVDTGCMSLLEDALDMLY